MDSFVLYDVGYMDIKDPQRLFNAIRAIDGVLLDIRFSPRSRNPAWVQENLRKALGASYEHLPALGNKNYKGDGPVEFVDLESGITTVLDRLQKRPVFIMCGCWNRESCHRHTFTEAFEKRSGIISIPLTYTLCKALASLLPQEDQPPPPQMSFLP